jgi:uncharacterized coiled-coil protein SlyX
MDPASPSLTAPHETPRDPARPDGVSRDTTRHGETSPLPVTIPDEHAISIAEAIQLSHAEGYPLAKSTLQRRAQKWHELAHASPVKCVTIVLPVVGSTYRLDREDLRAWLFEQRQNLRPHPTSPHPTPPRETPRDTMVHHETPQEREVRRELENPATHVAALENRIERLELQLDRKDEQIATLNRTLDATINQMSNTNGLLVGMQRMLAPLLGQADPLRKIDEGNRIIEPVNDRIRDQGTPSPTSPPPQY